jgi:hypothetical protein
LGSFDYDEVRARMRRLACRVARTCITTRTGAGQMNHHPPEAQTPQQGTSRRRQEAGDCLVLNELNRLAVLDDLDGEQATLTLLTFGSVREVCPACQHQHLKLVLRQHAVRQPHLFCAECERCFDAHYANGAPALTI